MHAPFAIQSVSSDLVSCPSHCGAARRNFESCRCGPTAQSNISPIDDIDTLPCDTVSGWLDDWYETLWDTGYLGKHFMEYSNSSARYVFRGLTAAHTCKVNRLMLKAVIYPGEFGVMGGNSSPNDPLFFVFHQIFEKMTQALRLSPRYRHLNVTWDNVGIGNYTGLGWNSATPFEAGLFEPGLGGEIDDATYLTNKQFWALLEPDGDTIPYVYDNFQSWGTCTVDFVRSPW